jgi:succinate dehydrogenase hydrophobic anchor subunit
MQNNKAHIPYRIKENSQLARIAAWKLNATGVAMVLGKTIHLYNTTKEDFLANERWVKHELCHVRQYEQYGFIPFLLLYAWESLLHGYHNNKFEKEARLAERAV